MSRRSATARIAASPTQPSGCFCTRHRIAIAAEACRPGGYFAISFLAKARFSSVNVKLAGCISFGARRRTDIATLSLHAARGGRVQGVDAVLPERACSAEHVVTDMGGYLDAVEDRQVAHGLHSPRARIVDDQLERSFFQDVARHRVLAVVAVLLAQDHAVALEQPRAALDRLDLDALDVELDQIFPVSRGLAVVEEIVERNHGHFLAVGLIAGNAESLVLGAGQTRGAARGADRALHG